MNTKSATNTYNKRPSKHITHFNWFARFESGKQHNQLRCKENDHAREANTEIVFNPSVSEMN